MLCSFHQSQAIPGDGNLQRRGPLRAGTVIGAELGPERLLACLVQVFWILGSVELCLGGECGWVWKMEQLSCDGQLRVSILQRH